MVESPAGGGLSASGLPVQGTALPESDAQLQGLYRRYCADQGALLASLLPRDAIRPLYRAALEAVRAPSGDLVPGEVAGAGGASSPDPLALLSEYCRSLLPLPPYEVWLRDFRTHRLAYLEALARSAGPEGRSEPLEVEAVSFLRGTQQWRACLHLFRDSDAWRGFIVFSSESGRDQPVPGPGAYPSTTGPMIRTADIFREEDPREVRNRFRDLSPATLNAFLRSALP